MNKKTLVFGASTNPSRYSYLAVKKLLASGHELVAFGNKAGNIDTVEIDTKLIPYKDIHTVTLYLSPKNQKGYYNYLISLKPKRIIFNPGTENVEFYNLLKQAGIDYEVACSLVLLSIDEY